MNSIEIRLSDADRKCIDGLTGAVSLLASVLGSMQPRVPAVVGVDLANGPDFSGSAPAPASDHPADAPVSHFEPPAPASDPAPAPAPAPVTLGEFQKALAARCAESDAVKAQVQALIRKYAECVSAIPENKRPEVLAALSQI